MNYRLRKLIISGVLLVFMLTAGAADTLKIHLTYKHRLNNAGQTTGFITINQQFYTPDGVLFREISYDEITSQLSGYVFYFYRNNRLFTQEFYSQKDSLQYILKYEYDQAGNEIAITKLVPGLNGLTVIENTVSTYDTDRKLLQQKKFFDNRIGIITRYQYDKSGLLEREKNTFKPIAKAAVKQETKNYAYSSGKRISQVMVKGKELSGKPYQFSEEYSYNDLELISAVKQVSIANAHEGAKMYKYLQSGAISLYEEYNAEGKLMLLLQYDYKKHYMDRGTQVSYYENL